MVIIGIDPGTATTGFGVIEKNNKNDLEVLAYGVIETSPKLATDQRLKIIHEELDGLIKKFKPQHGAIESLFFFKNQKTVIKVAQAQGAIILTMAKNHLPIQFFTPLQVKQALCGYGRAEKQQVQKMIKVLLKLECVPKPDDAADALAIAVCAAQSINRYIEK